MTKKELAMKSGVEKHGLKMVGLKKAAGSTKILMGELFSLYHELFYDRKTGEVWTVYQNSMGQSTWTEYEDKNIIRVDNITEPMTMQQIADLIVTTVTVDDHEKQRYAEMGIGMEE